MARSKNCDRSLADGAGKWTKRPSGKIWEGVIVCTTSSVNGGGIGSVAAAAAAAAGAGVDMVKDAVIIVALSCSRSEIESRFQMYVGTVPYAAVLLRLSAHVLEQPVHYLSVRRHS
jgi:hypothetical protein